MRLAECDSRRVVVWGAGREGLAAVTQLLRVAPNAEIAVVSDAPISATTAALLAPRSERVRCVTGTEGSEVLRRAEIVIRSPGISAYRDDCLQLVADGVHMTTGTDLWFAEHVGDDVVAVTGSKGKSTTASLVAHLFRLAGRRVVLAGNIGVPLLDVFEAPDAGVDTYVLELSSFQTAALTHSPSIGVLLNLHREHLDWHGSMERYVADKLNLVAHRRGGDRVVANHNDPRLRTALQDAGDVHWFGRPGEFHVDNHRVHLPDGTPLAQAEGLRIPGDHNLLNACAALATVAERGVDPAQCGKALRTFEPLPHRLQTVAEREGVRYIDDSISTIPEATLAAVAAMGDVPITLLVGGQDRTQDYDAMARVLAAHRGVVGVLGLPDNGDRVLAAVRALAVPGHAAVLTMTENVGDAVRLARDITPRGGVVLLSPGAPSYGRFASFEERGAAFRAAIGP